MRCGLNEVGRTKESGSRVGSKYFLRSRLQMLASVVLVALATACGNGGSGINPPPRGASDWFLSTVSRDRSAVSALRQDGLSRFLDLP